MSLILNIDTSVEGASICLAEAGRPSWVAESQNARDSAGWLHPAIKQLMVEAGVGWSKLEAVAVASGPGSYTGLRVGMSAAKGIAYSLNIPIIPVSTLKMMALAAVQAGTLLCPMIDARRMEVFTAVYDTDLQEVMPATNMILSESSFQQELDQNIISFFGNGSKKFYPINSHPNSRFISIKATAANLASLSHREFSEGRFADTAYLEPAYGKDFYSPVTKQQSY